MRFRELESSPFRSLTMKIGDRVRITKGPHMGEEFVIKYKDTFGEELHYSALGVCWYPEGSLELVDELKIEGRA
jgi:hypothetical protein